MPGILNRIADFTILERYVFSDEISPKDTNNKNVSTLSLILKYAAPAEKEAFYRGLTEEHISSWEELVKKSEDADLEQIDEAEQALAVIIDAVVEKTRMMEHNSDCMKQELKKNREAMKSGFAVLHNFISDQARGLTVSMKKEYDKKGLITALPEPDESVLKKANIFQCINERKSRRKYTGESLTLAELSYLLWATQGVKKTVGEVRSYRTVPSAGGRHPFETYLAVFRVEGLKPGVYRYLPFEHKLIYLFLPENMEEKLVANTLGQVYAGSGAVTFIWSALPYRCEWRYTLEARKAVIQDSGHLCQNLYLACESISCGTVGMGAYNQEQMDDFLKLDGEDEFVIYMAPVGKVAAEE